MSRYLKHFTAVGDKHKPFKRWHEEDEVHEASADPRPPSDQPNTPVTFRDLCRRLFSSEKFQIVVVCLVVLDAMFVLIELLMDLSIIKTDHEEIAPRVFHYLSLALLTFFMVELVGKIYAYRCEFFHHKFEVFDGIVVIVSFILDIVYISREDAFDGVGFLILLRLWRVARIINGIIVSVENRFQHKLHKLEETHQQHVQHINELQQHNSRLVQENDRLSTLLRNNGIVF